MSCSWCGRPDADHAAPCPDGAPTDPKWPRYPRWVRVLVEGLLKERSEIKRVLQGEEIKDSQRISNMAYGILVMRRDLLHLKRKQGGAYRIGDVLPCPVCLGQDGSCPTCRGFGRVRVGPRSR